MSTVQHAYHYAERLGLAVVPIPSGLKGPREAGWNKPENTVRTGQQARDTFGRQALNMGVLHSASDTGTLDIDHQEWAGMALAAIGYDLAALQAWPVRIKGKNGEKPFFRLGGRVFDRHSISWPHPTKKQLDKDGNETSKPVQVTLFELRAGAVQDVLPPSIHPDTGKAYEWAGTPPRERGDIPMISDELCDLWENWEDFAARMQAACPWQTAPITPAYKPCGSSSPKGERPGDHFRASVHVTVVLLRNGYVQKGARFLPPSASSTVAGVRILRGEDGIDRAFSDHGSCPLNNDHAHDSFSALAILEHGGNFRAAARAAALELGLTAPDTLPLTHTAEQVCAMWDAASIDLQRRGGQALDNMQGNSRVKNALIDLWMTLTEIAPTHIHEWQGVWVLDFGGLTRLKAYGVTGRNADITARIRQLTELGYFRKVIKVNPLDQTSPLYLEVPADPLTLPIMALTLEDSKRLIVRARDKPRSKVRRNLPNIKKALPKGIGEDTSYFALAATRLTVLYLACQTTMSVGELAEIRVKHPDVIRRQIRALEKAGLVTRTGHKLKLKLTWPAFLKVMKLEREADATIRRKVLRALERSEQNAKRRAFGLAAKFVPPRELAKRKRVWTLLHDRIDRVMAGETLQSVLGLAA